MITVSKLKFVKGLRQVLLQQQVGWVDYIIPTKDEKAIQPAYLGE